MSSDRRSRRRRSWRVRAFGAGRLSVARRHAHQSVPAGRRRRRGRPAVRGHARAAAQAAGGDRDQGRRGRRRSARSTPPAPSPTATRCWSTSCRSPASPRSTSCSAAQPKFTRADFIPIARFTEGPMVLVVNDQQPYKTLKELVDDAKKRPNEIVFSSSGLYGALHLPTALFMKAAGIQMRHLPTNGGGPGADRDPRQQLAGAGVLDRRRQRADEGRQARGAGVLLDQARGLAARRADAEGARLRRGVLAVGRAVRAEGHAGRGDRQAARRKPRRRSPARSSRPAIDNIGDEVAYLDQPDFAKFWDADAKRVEAAVQSIGKV